MKRTIIALLALAGVAAADTYELDMKDVTFGAAATLTSGNQAMNWADGAVYETWYMEFKLSDVTATEYKATITTGNATQPSNGLSVSAKAGSITLGTGNAGVISSAGSLEFTTTDTLTFAYYDGTAYLGNMRTQKYISASTDLPSPTTMTSGTSRAWSNEQATKIGATSIASLDDLDIPTGYTLDMGKLMTTGVAQSVPEPTTATLSLLALAGLAARRRRK
ncbi:MAG: PEP-CTERM sorting domain-containing protein [Akkermansia sp.]|nr:PEP-CTERM sorting domain-containing protein [Akkermansia sp.]